MRLNQVTVPSHDVARATEFYLALGLQLIVDDRPRYVRFLCQDGGSTFSVHRVESPISGDGAVVYFECDDLDAKAAALKIAGLRFEQDPVDQPWLWREAQLRDPDGNRLCLYSAGPNRVFPPWRVRNQPAKAG